MKLKKIPKKMLQNQNPNQNKSSLINKTKKMILKTKLVNINLKMKEILKIFWEKKMLSNLKNHHQQQKSNFLSVKI